MSEEEKRAAPNIPKDQLTPPLPKRFYTDVTVGDAPGGGFQILLDGRAVRTPKKQLLIVPTRALAEAIAAEWAAQDAHIDPSKMPLSKLAITSIDGVTGSMREVASDIVRYAGSDLLCYRAEAPATLAEQQARTWDPLLSWIEAQSGARFLLAEGVMPVTQNRFALERIEDLVAPYDAMQLAALHVMTTLTGSAFLALAVAKDRLSAEEAWDAAHIDEDWQIARWGVDVEATERRERRRREMLSADRFFRLLAAA
ncbi:putative domain ATP12 chaperone protein [Hyphomicrobium sp. 1Nfss2.1]|uniref:ATP12 family chaperone protein n=1 Tax=Hyphomicrobium sp. 1Nfss2.1 TaxID=3413936 RepID=UPI003C798AEC